MKNTFFKCFCLISSGNFSTLYTVSVTESEFDLGVITYSFMYQEQFSVFNSSNTAKVVSFSIPPEFTSMIDIFPKTGYVQVNNVFSK